MLSFEPHKRVTDCKPLPYKEDVLISRICRVHRFKTDNISMYTEGTVLKQICVKIQFKTVNDKTYKFIGPNTSAQMYDDLSSMKGKNKRIREGIFYWAIICRFLCNRQTSQRTYFIRDSD
jgi:hypothetical protein